MSDETNKAGQEEEKQPRSRAEILRDLLAMREKVGKGLIGSNTVIEAHYGAAKELLAAGDEEGAFGLMNSTMQLEAAYMGKENATYMGNVVNRFRETAVDFGASAKNLDTSAGKIAGSTEVLRGAASNIVNAATNIAGSATRFEQVPSKMQNAADKISDAAGRISSAAVNMSGHR